MNVRCDTLSALISAQDWWGKGEDTACRMVMATNEWTRVDKGFVGEEGASHTKVSCDVSRLASG